jgi:hypothetical protein
MIAVLGSSAALRSLSLFDEEWLNRSTRSLQAVAIRRPAAASAVFDQSLFVAEPI